MTVDIVSNGKQAVRILNENYYDLILLDMKMPEIDGGQILDYIKFQKKFEVPVVGMSGTPWLLKNSGFDAVLPKPFSMEKLKEMIQKLCYE
jgi:CheY-like chemotaxis protein